MQNSKVLAGPLFFLATRLLRILMTLNKNLFIVNKISPEFIQNIRLQQHDSSIFVLLSALRRVIEQYTAESLPAVPPDNEKIGYGSIHLTKTGNLLDMLHHFDVVESENPIPMESVGQVH